MLHDNMRYTSRCPSLWILQLGCESSVAPGGRLQDERAWNHHWRVELARWTHKKKERRHAGAVKVLKCDETSAWFLLLLLLLCRGSRSRTCFVASPSHFHFGLILTNELIFSFRAFLSQVSDVISVRLLSGTSAVLIFRCSSHTVQLPLSAVPYRIQPKESVSLGGGATVRLNQVEN